MKENLGVMGNDLYETLDRTKREVRLVILSAGPITAPIECRLTVASLQDSPQYEALSYCWGDNSDPERIMLQDRPFEVGKNLYRALLRLRREQDARTLWIDAICINQKDLLERAEQVELMGELYSITANCNIWLGEFFENFLGSPHNSVLKYAKEFPLKNISKDKRVVFHGDQSDTVIIKDFTDQYCSFFSNTLRNHGPGKVRYWQYLGAFCFLRSMADDDKHLRDYVNSFGIFTFPRILEALGNVLGASWWRRVWTVQEAVLPRKSTMLLGSISMPFETVLKACDRIRHHVQNCCSNCLKTLSMHDFNLITSEPFLTTGWMFELKKEYDFPGSSRIRGRSYSDLVVLLRGRQATDPRDKVYGLLGLFPEAWKNTDLLKPDYSQSLQAGKVYARATFRLFQLEGCMDFLYYCDGHSPADFISSQLFAQELPSDMPISTRWSAWKAHLKSATLFSAVELGLPSWVPHWTGLGGGGHKAIEFNASWGFHEPPDLLDDTLLSVVSRKIDKIGFIGKEFDGVQMRANLSELARLELPGRHRYGSSMKDAFLRTLIEDHWMIPAIVADGELFLGTGKCYRRATEADVLELSELLQDIVGTGLDTTQSNFDPEALRSINDKIRDSFGSLRRKTFFKTQTGYFGLGCGDVKVNDEVHIIVGASYPVVLRAVPAEKSGGKSTQTSRYCMVGRCYLHGVMYGEAMRDYEPGNSSMRITLA